MVLETVVEPVVLGRKTDEDASWPPMPCDDYLLRLSKSQIARQIILHFRQGHPAGLGRPAGRASLALGPSRRLRGLGLLFR